MTDKVRDHLANERTFLAWVRTALGMIGLGFVLARMGLFLRQLALTAGEDLPVPGQRPGAPRAVELHPGHEFLVTGVVFLAVGTVLCVWSAWSYDRNRKAIETSLFEPARWSVVGLSAFVVLGSLVLAALVIWRVAGE